ncbi:2-methoxy-6-polyprenyl-1,4-benzoquinol methylase, mitochondrial [Maniola hyperantus]|uniref:2-methoxy-6-polyprenyl-1,4-benzoquinol methylase, mitochondrial n=1 Tax=Aphantopus hyperantus TaxID=2795564 RepID=UPI001568B78D|nr:2-methoxy-6-polyprenyl-1,4-benzoquinol methylase, mitochondrial [Maniola hyperantus]XP_034828230.1 2-methoxy-6-polyprenyl-1,4-benzoquinol methylase, mitochondrial [Maniola hyperantus]
MALRRSVLTLINTRKASLRLCGAKHYSAQAEPAEEEKRKTHFGFETVNEDEKTKKVHEVFETVASKYDLMNDVMSFGVHRLWKDILMLRLAPTPGTKLLDMAGGTGDITFRYLNYLRNQGLPATDKRSSVTVCDINQHMLDVGKARAEKQGYTKDTSVDIDWLCADAENLPLPDDSYSAYTIAFGIRNCTRVDKVIEEAYRVLQPGGRFLCLEFSQLPNTTMQWVYDQYSFQMIPVLGQLIAGQWKPYQYLVESIRQFPHQEKFKSMIEEAGFRQVTYENLTFGVCAIHSGFKI